MALTHYEVIFYPAIGTLVTFFLFIMALFLVLVSIKEHNKKEILNSIFALVITGVLLFFCGSKVVEHFSFSSKMSNVFYGHPSNRYFVVSPSENGKIIAYSENSGFYCFAGVPKEMQSRNSDDLRYILYIKRTENLTGSYTNGAKAIRLDYELRLVDLKDWRTVGETTLAGGIPPSSTGSGGKIEGKAPKKQAVYDWVYEQIEKANNENKSQ